MIMMHHKAPHRNQAAPSEYLGIFGKDKNYSLPSTYFDNYATKCPASEKAENKVRNLYHTLDLKLKLPDGVYNDPGIGGGSLTGYNAS